MILGMLTLAVRRELIPCRWWCAAVPGAFTGSIPAWAGEPMPRTVALFMIGVYPRVGGGTNQRVIPVPSAVGLSPRGRGNQNGDAFKAALVGSIPAWAGEPLIWTGSYPGSRVYPRVGGGTPIAGVQGELTKGLSPRGRGNRRGGNGSGALLGSIPAWAGEPWRSGGGIPARWVYPRVGGGTASKLAPSLMRAGLSPRGRGNRRGGAGEPAPNKVYPRVGGGTTR